MVLGRRGIPPDRYVHQEIVDGVRSLSVSRHFERLQVAHVFMCVNVKRECLTHWSSRPLCSCSIYMFALCGSLSWSSSNTAGLSFNQTVADTRTYTVSEHQIIIRMFSCSGVSCYDAMIPKKYCGCKGGFVTKTRADDPPCAAVFFSLVSADFKHAHFHVLLEPRPHEEDLCGGWWLLWRFIITGQSTCSAFMASLWNLLTDEQMLNGSRKQ